MGPELKETYGKLMFVDKHDHEDDANERISGGDDEDDESDEDTGAVQANGSSQESSYDEGQILAKKSRTPYPEDHQKRMKNIVGYKRSVRKCL